MSKKRGHKKVEHYTKHIVLLILALIACVVVGSIIRIYKTPARTKTMYHGPNPITMAGATKKEDESVLGRYTQRIRVRITPTPTPTSTPAPIPTPTSRITSNRDYGIAAGGGLTWLNQADLDIYFTNLQSLGIKWVRWDFDWSAIQPTNSTNFEWTGIDRVASEGKKFGINTLGIITYSPPWASNNNCAQSFQCAPADPKAFGSFAGTIASRYKNSISFWEIWNEPNFGSFLGSPPNIQKYVDILNQSYTAIKTVNPEAVVISGGLAASGNESNGDTSPVTFVNSLYTLHAQQYFDAIALHPYSYPASTNFVASWNSWQQMYEIRQIMVNNGDSAKKIWVTEYGAPTGGSGTSHEVNQLSFNYGTDYMSLNAQNELLIEATTFYKQNTSWMGPFFWYSLWDNGTSTSTTENFFGLLRKDWSKKPSFTTLQNAIATP